MKETKQQVADEIRNVASAAALVIKEAAGEAAKLLAATTQSNNAVTAVLANDIVTIKGDVKEIKDFQRDSIKTFVSMTDFAEHLKSDVDHETRIRVLEQSMWKQVGMSSLIASIITIGLTLYLHYH